MLGIPNTGTNIAMTNRAVAFNEARLDRLEKRVANMNVTETGTDLVFTTSVISGEILAGLLDNIGVDWLNSSVIENATIYECTNPPAKISQARPDGLLKGVVDVNGSKMETYSPLESFVRQANGSLLFNPLQSQLQGTTDAAAKNYGGSIMNIVNVLTSGRIEEDKQAQVYSNILSSEYFNTNSLYYVQNTDLIFKNFGASAESFSLHFN
jgi:hypothetical protein